MIYHNLFGMQEEISWRIILCAVQTHIHISPYKCMVFCCVLPFLGSILLLISTWRSYFHCFFLGILVIVWFYIDVVPIVLLFFGMPQTHEYQMAQSHQLTIRIQYMYDIYYWGRNQIQTAAAATKNMQANKCCACDVSVAAAARALFLSLMLLLRCFHLYLSCKLHGR